MPRPSLKAQRREEILDAAQYCIARFGVEGTTLDRIAERANLARPLIRHNLGNRAEIIEAVIDRFILKSDEGTQWLVRYSQGSAERLLEFLFSADDDDQAILVAQALNIAAAHDRKLAKRMRTWTDDFTRSISEVLNSIAPQASNDACDEVAIGIIGIYFSTATFEPLNPDPRYKEASKKMARCLMGLLV